MKKLTIFLLLLWSQGLIAGGFDCSNWPKTMAFLYLKDQYLVDSKIDLDKIKAQLLNSELIGNDLYREMYLIRYFDKSGEIVEVVTISDASSEECSMSDVDVYVKLKKI